VIQSYSARHMAMTTAGALPPLECWEWLVDAALREDIGSGDATSQALLGAGEIGSASVVARQPLVIAGLPLAQTVFERCFVRFEYRVEDGMKVDAGAELGRVTGLAAAILTAERTALNFLQRLCGVATYTARFTAAIAGTRARICDTRKTTPGWRVLEKYAVRCGGGVNHRMGLFDGILIKDNHIASVGSIKCAVTRAREHAPFGLRVQVEVESLADAREAVDAGADALLADNQTPEALTEIVRWIAGRVPVEATGGVTLDNVRAYAETGVDRISIGALTHSAPAADLSLEWDAASKP